MTFVFPFLLGGLVLVGIPVLIHLIMRQKPKTLPFPAFRFLVQRHRTNLRKLRLRHLLLLALRIGLILLICLALARPKVFNEALKLGADRPVAAILVFDTSRSMEYAVSSSKGKLTRLDDARRRGRELLGQLPDGSKVLVLDSADPTLSGKGDWLNSMHQAGKRIDGLRLRDGGGPVTARVEDAYRLFNELARAKVDDAARHLARLLVVFSDLTLASWDAGRLRPLQDARDQIPPPFERLPQLRDRVPGIIEMLGTLRTRLPLPAGLDFPEQALIDLLEKARDRAAGLSEDEYPDPELSKLVTAARGRARDLLGTLDKIGKGMPAGAKEYHDKLLGVLHGLLHDLRGVHEIYIDVGVADPADGALLDFELPRDPRRSGPRQVFAADQKIIVRAVVRATGKDVANTLRWTLGKRTEDQPVEVKAGAKQAFAFSIHCKDLAPGEHQLRAELVTPDLLPAKNMRYLTFAIREPRNVLVLSDDPRQAKRWKEAHDALREAGAGEFRVMLRTPEGLLKDKSAANVLNHYQAVYLFAVAEPSADLWALLQRYVASGGGLGVIPGGAELKPEAYNSREAQAVLPGTLAGVETVAGKEGAAWDLESIAYRHPMMARYRVWKTEQVDFVKYPPTASRFWRIKSQDLKEVTALAKYAGRGQPALLERLVGGATGRPGRVVLFTTPLDIRKPPWNDYRSTLSSFYLALAYLTTSHLAGDTEPVQLNFLSGQTVPVVAIPLNQRRSDYTLKRGPEHAGTVNAEATQNVLRLPQALAPGNYTVEGDGKPAASFSVNLPAEETNLTRLPAAQVEALFGKEAVVPVDVRADLRAAMSGQWSQPEEMLPWLLLTLLFALAVENLLANKFYRKEPEAQA